MVRKLAIALLGAGAFLPSVASALGLGEIELKSYLNQPLTANIELLEVQEYDSSEIRPKLAAPADFQNAGIERSAQLLDLRFRVDIDAKGRTFIVVSSERPIREPFLNFLMEVHWPAGRVLREYTILLDPPVFSEDGESLTLRPSVAKKAVEKPEEPVAPVALKEEKLSPAVVVETEVKTELKPKPEPEPVMPVEPITPAVIEPSVAPQEDASPISKDPLIEAATPKSDKPVLPEPVVEVGTEKSAATFPVDDMVDGKKAAVVNPPLPMDLSAPEAVSVKTVILPTPFPEDMLDEKNRYVDIGNIGRPNQKTDEYGPVKQGEVLWNIAEKNKPAPDVSVHQVMVAIQRQNPDSFNRGNVNMLKKGSVLRLPAEDEVREIAKIQAQENIERQSQEWRSYVAKIVGTGSQVPEYTEIKTSGSQVTPLPVQNTTVSDDRVSIVVPNDQSQGSTTTGGTGGNVDTSLLLAQEEVDRFKLEARESQDRVRDLEEMLKNQEGLLNLKDEEISKLQQQLRESREKLKELEEKQAAAEANKKLLADAPPTDEPIQSVDQNIAINNSTETLPPPEVQPPIDDQNELVIDIDMPSEMKDPDTGEPPLLVDGTDDPLAVDSGMDPMVDPLVDASPIELEPSIPVEVPVVEDGLGDDGVGEPEPAAQGEQQDVAQTGGGLDVQPMDPVQLNPTDSGNVNQQTEPSGGLMAKLADYWMVLAAALGGVALIGGMALLKRRRSDDSDASEEDEEFETFDVVEDESTQILGEETTGFDSEETQIFGVSTASSIAAEETTPLREDPLSEADMFLAYGKYDYAVRVLSSGLAQEPNNADYMLKMLEVYAHRDDQEGFKSYMEEVLSVHPDAREQIDIISKNHFGRSLAAVDATSSVIDDEFDIEAPSFDVEEATPVVDPEPLAKNTPAKSNAPAKSSGSKPSIDLEESELPMMDLEFDFEDNEATAVPSSKSGAAKAATPRQAVDELDQLADDLEASLEDVSADDLAAELALDLGEDLDVQESVEDIELDVLPEIEEAPKPAKAAATAARGGLSMDIGLDSDLDSLISGDEIGTKLELAQAYMDMGSNEEARDILNEVLEEGSEAQKSEAQSLIERIA